MNSQPRFVFRLFAIAFLLLPFAFIQAQQFKLKGQKAGIYLSSKAMSFDSDYHIWINQVLSLEDDRSWEDNQKVEFLIRLGKRWSAELQRISGADTVIFINGDVELGKQYLESGAVEMLRTGKFDAVISLDSLFLETRSKRVNFIRSNKLLTAKRTIRHARMHSTVYRNGKPPLTLSTCFDEDLHKFPPVLIDLYAEDSVLGKFCSGLLSQWWLEVYSGNPGRCK